MPEEKRSDVGAHGFSQQGTTALFDVKIINLYAGSYLCVSSEKALKNVEKEKKNRYLQACLERRYYFTTSVFSSYGIPGKEAKATTLKLTLQLIFKLQQEYYEMYGFVLARMVLYVVRSDILLMWVLFYK